MVRRTSALPAYQIIHNEVIAAIDSFYTFLAIHNFAAEELEVRRYLTEAGSFWNLQLYSLRTTLFIVVARIFDDAPDAHSVHKLVAATIAHPQFFSKHALGARKTPPGQPKPPWLDEYLANVQEPSVTDLRLLRKAVAPHKKTFEELYRPIRHEVFAHKILKDGEAVSALFGQPQDHRRR